MNNVVPQALASRDLSSSELWAKDEVRLLKGKSYLFASRSGAGKSTLCSYLIGERNDYSGQLLFDGKDARSLSEQEWDKLRQEHISILWQNLKLFKGLTVWENLLLKNKQCNYLSEEKLLEHLDLLEILDKKDQLIEKLSLGQQQRVACIRALCQPFDFLILDEPISHLDEETALLLNHLVREEVERRSATLLVTSIGLDLAGEFDQVLKL